MAENGSGGNAGDDKGDDKDDGAGGDQGDKKDDKQKADDNSAETRVKKALEKAAAAEAKLKEREEADKKAEEDRLAKAGEHEKLAKTREEERDAAVKDRDESKAVVAEYEAMATEQITAALETITDKEKKESAQAMLEGLSVREQYKKLPSIMKLVGGSAPAFGGQTPASDKTPDKTTEEQKKKRLNDLITKKVAEGKLTPQEDVEKQKLANELSSFLKS